MIGMIVREISRVRLQRAGRGMVAVGVMALASAVGVVLAGPGGAQPLPFCGGQNAAPRPVPYTCTTQTQTIDGSQVFAVLHADGQTVTVTYHLLAPRATDAPIRISHHIGVSGAGGPRSTANGVIPAGQTTATLVVTTPCFAGQVDIKFVFILDTQPQGRVGGPWIENGTGCTTPTTTTTTTTPTTTPITTVTTVPTSTAGSSVATTTVPGTASQSSVAASTLPATGARGMGASTLALALGAVAVGVMLLVVAARRAGAPVD